MPDKSQQAVVEDFTPYQMTLMAMVFPWWIHALFDVAAGIGLALTGAPLLGFTWAAGLCLVDGFLQKLYGRWSRTAAGHDSPQGLRRLSLTVLLRTSLWFIAPLAYVLLSHSQPGFALLVVTATSMSALGVSLGWTSGRMFLAMVGPAVLAVAVATVGMLGPGPAVGVMVGLASLSVTLTFIAIGTHRNISEWSQANRRTVEVMAETKAALARSEAAERRLGIAIEITDLHVYEVDYSARKLASLGTEESFYQKPLTYEQFWSDPWFSVAPEDLERVKAAWAQYEAGGEAFRTEYRVNRTDGREVWAFAAAEITRDRAGVPRSLVGAVHDITERKRSEIELTEALSRAEAGSRAKSDFLATISHEIRTPLNGVLGMAQAMERDDLDATQRERVQVIRRSGESLLVLLNSVLDLSKIEAGRFELDNAEVEIETTVQTALDAFSADAAEKDVSLALDIEPDARAVYAGDPGRVSQVIYNLISNAVKFTHQGSIVVRVRQEGAALVIAVADTGIGMSPDQLDGVFEKFVQADSSVTRRFGGSGLGLAICEQLVAKMGGSISAQSDAGRGSTFTLSLPLARLRGSGKPQRPEPKSSEAQDQQSSLRVLAAEDNPVNQLVLRTLLQQVGIEPVIASDGREALAAWRGAEWDIILMDIQMPEVDGVTAAQTIRSEEAASSRRRTPIVALTANVMAHHVEAYHAAGMDEVVAKPIEVGRLISAMQACLDTEVSDETPTAHAAA